MALDAQSWTFLDAFRWSPPRALLPSWAPAQALAQLARRALDGRCRGVEARLIEWDVCLHDLGGDPSRRDWRRFRPLRLSREEDWSDWLAHLLESSSSGILGSALFEGDVEAYRAPAEVRREWTLPGGFRADLAMRLRDGAWVHLEVKVGDQTFLKTFDEARAIREALGPVPEIRTFILLPGDSMDAWVEARTTAEALPGTTAQVRDITWACVAVGLRRSLRSRSENASWSAWAYAYVGAVEQRLLGTPHLPRNFRTQDLSYADLVRVGALVDVLERVDHDD
ncbi:MAG: hypothetical protein EPO40_21975 [Myxococcaceae bacterium]|nr:MAG: hypothetical protein EPO40_21975 [Myxococcaceae bacterium]